MHVITDTSSAAYRRHGPALAPAILGWLIMLTLGLSSCSKNFLSVKRKKSQAVPETLAQFQALLNNEILVDDWPEVGLLACDNMYLSDETLAGTSDNTRANYVWGDGVFDNLYRNTWSNIYTGVFYANLVLDGLKGMSGDSVGSSSFNNVKGQALFLRACAFYSLVQTFAKTYDSHTASKDLGIALRLSSDLNTPTKRATVQETYNRIIKDLSASIDLLPLRPDYKIHASKPAVLAMLARTYLVMGDYENARTNAEGCLAQYDSLIDYNTLDASRPFPFSLFNKETIYFSNLLSATSCLYAPKAKVDSGLYKMYADNDLRKSLFFKPIDAHNMGFYGDYTGEQDHFAGIATDEVLLIVAECDARLGEKDKAMSALNALLVKRYKKGTFTPLVADNADHALDVILRERRKELLFRGLRWTDLKRLNLDPERATTITRLVNGQLHTLKPNDLRYVFPIPRDVVAMTGIPQNPR